MLLGRVQHGGGGLAAARPQRSGNPFDQTQRLRSVAGAFVEDQCGLIRRPDVKAENSQATFSRPGLAACTKAWPTPVLRAAGMTARSAMWPRSAPVTSCRTTNDMNPTGVWSPDSAISTRARALWLTTARPSASANPARNFSLLSHAGEPNSSKAEAKLATKSRSWSRAGRITGGVVMGNS
jgi:hypothetical protein